MYTKPPTLSIGGLTPFTTIDFPEHLAAVIFCQGCAWRCSYCYNTHLLDTHAQPTLSWDNLEAFLQRRQGLLEAVVFSGGEPTLQKGLLEAVQRVRYLGFKVGLHTAGMNSNRLAKLLPYLDWIGFDIKAPFARYATITGVPGSNKHPQKSAKLVIESGIDYEFRTTVHPQLLNENELLTLATSLADLGVQQYVLQNYYPTQPSSLPAISPNPILNNNPLIQAIRTLIPRTILR